MQKGFGLIGTLLTMAVLVGIAMLYFSHSQQSAMQNPKQTIIEPIQEAKDAINLVNQHSSDVNSQLH